MNNSLLHRKALLLGKNNEVRLHSNLKNSFGTSTATDRQQGYWGLIWSNLPYSKTVFHHVGQMMIQDRCFDGVLFHWRENTRVDWVCLCERVCRGFVWAQRLIIMWQITKQLEWCVCVCVSTSRFCHVLDSKGYSEQNGEGEGLFSSRTLISHLLWRSGLLLCYCLLWKHHSSSK